MSKEKVLFVNQEIMPYIPESEMSKAGLDLPKGIQERGYEVRTFMPKYGCINERRNQLHEVIRLSGMNLIIDDTDHPLIIKVATLQPARMQVYFIYNEDYFQRNPGKGLETEESPELNDERCIFFVRGTIETVKKLRWEASIVHCQGWLSALTPLYVKKVYADDPSFRGSKVVYSLYGSSFNGQLDPRFEEKLRMEGFSDDDLKSIAGRPVDFTALAKLALAHSDGVIIHTETVAQELLDFIKENKIPCLPYEGSFDVDKYAEFYKTL
ncbi:MAG: glycogen/starch synthase [Muribaculaceae bacterium]|nr:glycogen/starch synthase [Muribaculaceae bacterium]